MVLSKEELWERIRIKSLWLMPQRTPFFGATEEHMSAGPVLTEQYMRYICFLHFEGNAIVAQSAKIEKQKEDLSYEVLFSDIQIQPSAMPEIPAGGYDPENPIIPLEGGTNLYGHVNGNSINVTVIWWDNEI
jgi:hypothetical protein